MRKFNHYRLMDSLIANNDHLNEFYSKLNRDDRGFVFNLLEGFPNLIQFHLMRIYQAEATPFLANTKLREISDALRNEIPNVLKNNFELSEDELRSLAEKCANRCARVKARAMPKNDQVRNNSQYLYVFKECAVYTESTGVKVPNVRCENTLKGGIKRMLDSGWWLGKLRKLVAKARETVMIHLGLVNKKKGLYCSDLTVSYRRFQKHYQLEAMKALICTNELGETLSVFDLWDKNVSNPINRRNELMTRTSGFESISKEQGHKGLFVTLTCPSKYHNSYAKSGDRNIKWENLTPYDGQRYLCQIWARIRAELKRRAIEVYGFRIAEPQHDGTPHWHLLLFLNEHDVMNFKEVTTKYSLAEDGDENGALENRVTYIDIDPKKGSATGYIAKYICKNIDGANLDEGINGENPIEAAERVEAWASCWGIRQFQQIGGVSVTVWRELRRLADAPKDNELKEIREVADKGNWALFTNLMGGVFCKRKEQKVKPHYDIDFDLESGEVKCSWFDETPFFRLKGVVHKGLEIITRVHTWTLTKSSERSSSLLGVL